MRGKAIGWVIVFSMILFGAQTVLGGSEMVPGYIHIYGGFADGGYPYWPLTDENSAYLEDGDVVMVVWTGPDGAVDPPIRAAGHPQNGKPTGDDQELILIFGSGVIEYSVFDLLPFPTWQQGDLDSLGRQRRPAQGDKIYVRLFNDGVRENSTAFGESDLHVVAAILGENFYTQMPNDPVGPTTDQVIFGRFFKIIGGIDPSTGVTHKLRDPSADLVDGSRVQLIYAGPDGQINGVNPGTRLPGGDDELIETWGVNEGMHPATGTGVFKRYTASFDAAGHGLPALGDKVYVRLWNRANRLEATHYGESPLYDITYVIGESLSVFTDAAVDCNTAAPDSGWKDFTIYGGEDEDVGTFWPLENAFGVRLQDGDLVQMIWTGSDEEIDPLDELDGTPTGDDELMAEWGIGEGIAGTGLGRFIYETISTETRAKDQTPVQGDIIYLRVFDGPTLGEDGEATRYGESETYEVQWEFGETWYSFPDTLYDAITRVPWYKTIRISGGLDTNHVEYPLTDSLGMMLEDGDLVQLIWAGTNETIDPLDEDDCSPTGDDSLLTTWPVGTGYGEDTGLFRGDFRTYSAHKGGFPAQGDVIYLRIFNGADPTQDAPYYGESATHTIAWEQDEVFYAFPDSALDADMKSPCSNAVEEWANPTDRLPAAYALHQNYPNPFNPETDIQYQIPEAGRVELIVYNVLGQSICTLVDGHRAAGSYTVRWFGTDDAGRALSSGIYFYRLMAGDFTDVRKMVLLK